MNRRSRVRAPSITCIFFQFVPNKRGIFSCNKRYFELLYSLLVTRLKKNIKMLLYGNFERMLEKLSKMCTHSSWGFKMLEHAWDRAAALTGVSRATAQRIITKKVELLSSLVYWASDIASLVGMTCPNPLSSL